jgi:hypothetical protein
MKRITISMPDKLALILADEARRGHRSVSEVAREAIECHLSNHGQPREIPFIGIGRSKRGDSSQRVDEILAEEWTSERLRGGQ